MSPGLRRNIRNLESAEPRPDIDAGYTGDQTNHNRKGYGHRIHHSAIEEVFWPFRASGGPLVPMPILRLDTKAGCPKIE